MTSGPDEAPGAGPMEILHLGKYYPPEPGGMEMAVKGFAEATEGRLSNYCLVATRRGPTRIEAAKGATVHLLKQWGTVLLTPILPTLPAVLTRLRRERRFAAILLHYPNPTAVLALFLSLRALPKREKLVVWHHADILLEEGWKRALHRLYRPIEEEVLRHADAFVAATPHHVPRSASFARFAGRTSIVPFGVPDGWFDVGPGEEAAAREVRARLGGRFVLFVGRLIPYKGLDLLVDAAGKIGARIAVIGTGPLEGVLRRAIARRDLREKVLLLGKVEDLRPYYLASEFLVLPSKSALEGFGIVQIEAMALGKPVVTSDLPSGVTYVNLEGVTGLTFPVGDAEALAAACNRLLDDDALKVRLGAAARVRTREEFSYTALGARAVSFFRDLCGAGGS